MPPVEKVGLNARSMDAPPYRQISALVPAASSFLLRAVKAVSISFFVRFSFIRSRLVFFLWKIKLLGGALILWQTPILTMTEKKCKRGEKGENRLAFMTPLRCCNSIAHLFRKKLRPIDKILEDSRRATVHGGQLIIDVLTKEFGLCKNLAACGGE